LAYGAQTQGPLSIPLSEGALQAVVAKPWFKVSGEGRVLEGAIFDRNGNLLFCDVSGRRLLRLTQDKRLSTVLSLDTPSRGGLALHKDGAPSLRPWILAKALVPSLRES
jgi:lactonase